MLQKNTLKIGSNARGNISLLMILLMLLVLQTSSSLNFRKQKKHLFRRGGVKYSIGPFQRKMLVPKIEISNGSATGTTKSDYLPHYYYNSCFPCSLKFLVTTFKEGV